MTPTDLKPLVLRTMAELSGLRAGVDVPCSEVTARILSATAPTDPDGERRTRNNVNWAGTQLLVAEGLVGKGSMRGRWVLTDAGLDVVRALRVPLPTPDPGGVTPPHHYGGGGFALLPRIPRLPPPEDPYILSLLISQTPCFGVFGPLCPSGDGCVLFGPCQTQMLERVGTLAVGRHDDGSGEDAGGPAPSVARERRKRSLKGPTLEEVLGDIPGTSIGGSDATRTGRTIVTRVDSLCYVCGGPILEGTQAIFVRGFGLRHTGACRK